MSSEAMQYMLRADAERKRKAEEREKERALRKATSKRSRKHEPKAPAPPLAQTDAPSRPAQEKETPAEAPAVPARSQSALPPLRIEAPPPAEVQPVCEVPAQVQDKGKGRGNREDVVLHIGKTDSYLDDSVLTEYMNKIFTPRDIEQVGRSMPNTENPCRYLERLGLHITLAAKLAEGEFKDIYAESSRVKKAMREMEASKERAVREAERAKSRELEKLQKDLKASEEELKRKDGLLTESMQKGVEARNDVDRVKDELKWARRDHEKEIKQLKRLLGEAGPVAVEAYKKSPAFMERATEIFMPTYDESMQVYRAKLTEVYPDLDLSALDKAFPGSVKSSDREKETESEDEDDDELTEVPAEGLKSPSPEIEIVGENVASTDAPAVESVVEVDAREEEPPTLTSEVTTATTPEVNPEGAVEAEVEVPTVADPSEEPTVE